MFDFFYHDVSIECVLVVTAPSLPFSKEISIDKVS